MISRARTVMALLCAALLAVPVLATYAGDKPLFDAYTCEGKCGYAFSTGNSTYSGTLLPGDQYPVEFTVTLPDDAVVQYQRYYVYWAWSRRDEQSVYPSIAAISSPAYGTSAEPVVRYTDNKGFSSPSDFYSGVDAFSGAPLPPGTSTVTFGVANTAESNSTFVIQGIGLLAVYSSASEPEGLILVKEGCDMLYYSYGITPEMATSSVDFNREIDTARMKSATLELVAPSGGYTRSDVIRKNALYFNHQQDSDLPKFLSVILGLVFPYANGKEWVDVFDSDQQQQIGIETRDVTAYMAPRSNTVAVQDRGDYLLLTNVVLHIVFR
ncbi:MAG: DUF3344 domain-containing protein [Methanoregula sp.]|jgi:hypothetical protein|uniref:DUF3344 domain-containing protein n=1 Tax=Methanoregula sp. TaxID=2052170 RepID=UPI0025E53EA9|nr:DUF3344 domain-containing protein [Methanoregula sp.]MCK9632415.1 DUF3344 domain-containing protein [Methanoregula sp.]